MPDPARRPYRNLRSFAERLVTVVFPTLTVLVVLAILEGVTQHRLLFASLASSAFLGHIDPRPGRQIVTILVLAQLCGAAIGWAAFGAVGPGYAAAGVAVFAVTLGMVTFDVLHPPAVSTALAFAFKADDDQNLSLFLTAVAATAAMVSVGRAAHWVVARPPGPPRQAASAAGPTR